MGFPDLPDSETLRVARELSKQSNALKWEHDLALLRRKDSAFDHFAYYAFEEFRRRQDYRSLNHVIDLFSGQGSALVLPYTELLRSKAEQSAIETWKAIKSSALERAVTNAYESLLLSQRDVFHNATIDAIRKLWRLDNPAFQALRSDAFASSLMTFVREHQLANDEAIEELQQIVDKKVATLPRGRISADGILNLILMVALFLAGIAYQEIRNNHSSSSPLTDAQVERIISSVEKTKTLIPEDDNSTYYVVERATTVRVRANNRSSAVAYLYPNQKVRLEKRNHRWIYIEYFDYIEGIPKMGWADKKYFKKLN